MLPFAAAALFLSACDDSVPIACTEIGCSSSTVVFLTAASGVLPVGEYEVLVTSEGGGVADCTFQILGDCNGSDVCFEDLGTCSVFGSVGGGEPDSVTLSHGLIDGVLDLQVLIDGVEVYRADQDPASETHQPNGEDCPPTCTSREASIELATG